MFYTGRGKATDGALPCFDKSILPAKTGRLESAAVFINQRLDRKSCVCEPHFRFVNSERLAEQGLFKKDGRIFLIHGNIFRHLYDWWEADA